MGTPREHIEQIRRSKFSIGGEPNPLTEDLHQAVKNLSAELYAKDVHFLMELIQNAEDNAYLEDVDPSLEFVLTSRDITGTGAPATLLIFNNEKGFSAKNIDSVCSVGKSTKKGNRKRGYIGEKGIGFKSVFLITASPYIFSNGYQIRFDEAPCPHCNLGYIVPEWVDSPTLSDVKEIYGSTSVLPSTIIMLPLKADKLKPVKEQLSSIHPEVLLFLSKIKDFSVKEDTEDPKLSTLSAISISRETNFLTRKNIDAESYTLYLSAAENCDKSETECSYYMWRQKFPVKQENKVEKRMEAEEFVITLAFPNGERLRRGMSSTGVYAFLPTEMVTNFPFIIQADFILASSREYILLNDKWNQGILDCVPSAFINAITALVKADAPVSNVPRMFEFLPVEASSYKEFNAVRESIRARLSEEHIIPSESYTKQKFFHKPCEVGRIMPTFWNILRQSREQGVSLQNLSSHGRYILSSSFDKSKYNHILNFLGVEPVDNEWYAKCIQGSAILPSVNDKVYLELLLFLANGWSTKFQNTTMKNFPLIKYAGLGGGVSFCSIRKSANPNSELSVCISHQSDHISWLLDWNKEFISANCYFLPESTQKALLICPEKEILVKWLTENAKVCLLTVSSYADHVCDVLSSGRKPIIAFGHFLYHSSLKGYLSEGDVKKLSRTMPVVDSYGNVTKSRVGVLVPASGSKWAGLIGANPWGKKGYVELGEDYLHSGHFAGEVTTPREKLVEFLKSHGAACDVPDISPPNDAIPTASSPLTKENVFLLLDWIRYLRYTGVRVPEKFLTCLKKGNWLRVVISGSHGYRPPSQSFHLASSWGEILQNGSVLVDIPLIDNCFYGDQIEEYKEELKTVGVMFDPEEAYKFIGNHFMSMLSSSLTRASVYSILNFIRFLREKLLPPDKLIDSIKKGRWLRTKNGERSPCESVIFSEDWKVSSQISNIPFIDESYYGEEILSFKTELQLLGVVFSFNQNYQLLVDNLKDPSCFASLSPEAILLLLECMNHMVSPSKIVDSLRSIKCLKTSCGYKSPGDCFLFDPVWGCLLQAFSGFPLIEQNIYGASIFSYKNELKRIGVVVDFEDAMKRFVNNFEQLLSSFRKENVLSLLSCFRQLKGSLKFPSSFKKCILEQKWLRTRLGDNRSPKNCILFNQDWASISQITTLPFVADDDNYYGKEIHEYREELKSLGVIVDFKAGVKFVLAGLSVTNKARYLTRPVALSLLECIHLQEPNASLPASFVSKVSQMWLKTHIGYKHPEECLLFDSTWDSYLERTDGPFIDEEFYGSKITSQKEELKRIGVRVDVKEGFSLSLVSNHIDLHSTFTTIVRIYKYLNEFNWQPDSEEAVRIWIPHGSEKGEWVSPRECVLHDKDRLFSSRLHVLEKHYNVELFGFFSKALNVRYNPSAADYCKVWKDWEDSNKKVSHDDCCRFWGSVSKHWSSEMERALAETVVKVPVSSCSDGGILLLDKHDVFIADDLLLKDLLEQNYPHPIFVWYPKPSSPSLPHSRLIEMYKKIGIRTISESVQKNGFSSVNDTELREVDSGDILIKRGLVQIVLGFLSKPSLNMVAKKRHETVKCLLNLTVLEMVEPVTLSYSLSLSSGEVVDVKASRSTFWDREGSKLLMQKTERSGGYKNLVQHATYFSEVISEGLLLWEKEGCAGALSELIKLAFFVDFDEEALDFVMKSKNMQIFVEDEEFLSSAFP